MSINSILEIDAGNTDFKWRTLSGSVVVTSGRAAQKEVEITLSDLLKNNQSIKHVRVVSVAGKDFDQRIVSSLKAFRLEAIDFAVVEDGIGGIRCGYSELSQLGVDRWMAIIAAASACAGPILVVDMGSALTIDLVDGKRQHCGGYILPGWRLMQKSLLEGTAIHPSRIPYNYEVQSIEPGLNTVDAIGMGRIKAMTSTIDSILNDFENRLNANVSLVCTGGDAPHIMPHLESEVLYKPDLVLDGLSIALG